MLRLGSRVRTNVPNCFMRFPPDNPTLFAENASPWAAMSDYIAGRTQGTYPVHLSDAHRLQHVYVVGRTGAGKTTLLETLMRQDLERGHGFAFFDPHGDLADRLLYRVPHWRTRHTLYFHPADLEHPMPFNILAQVPQDQRHLVVSAVVSTVKRLWPDSWGPRTEHLLRNATFALLEAPGATLLDIPRLLTDPRYRDRILPRITNPAVRAFWLREFASYSPDFRNEVIAPLQNKLGTFLAVPPLRNILGQRVNLFDLRTLMDRGHVFIANLSKGELGEDSSALLGSLLLTRFLLAALSRADTPEEERRPFHVYVDEFPSFAAPSTLSTFLSEARKYATGLALAHQHLAHLPDELRGAIFGNVGTLAAFQVSAEDADYLAREFEPTFTRAHLTNLDRYHFLLRLTGTPAPFLARTIAPSPLPELGPRERAYLLRHSRRRYTRPRSLIDRTTAKRLTA